MAVPPQLGRSCRFQPPAFIASYRRCAYQASVCLASSIDELIFRVAQWVSPTQLCRRPICQFKSFRLAIKWRRVNRLTFKSLAMTVWEMPFWRYSRMSSSLPLSLVCRVRLPLGLPNRFPRTSGGLVPPWCARRSWNARSRRRGKRRRLKLWN